MNIILYFRIECSRRRRHKILQYIKNNSNNKLYDIIYGLDADLIMLALITNSKNIALLREPVHFQKNIDEEEKNDNKFLYLEINNLKENLLIELFNKLDTKLDFDMISNNLIRDYIFLCMLIGNDYRIYYHLQLKQVV